MGIEKAKNRCNELIKAEHANWIGISNQEAIKVLLNELDKKDKIIDKLLTEITVVNSGRYEYMDNKEVLEIFTKKAEGNKKKYCKECANQKVCSENYWCITMDRGRKYNGEWLCDNFKKVEGK